jgi:hypothetical protein
MEQVYITGITILDYKYLPKVHGNHRKQSINLGVKPLLGLMTRFKCAVKPLQV